MFKVLTTLFLLAKFLIHYVILISNQYVKWDYFSFIKCCLSDERLVSLNSKNLFELLRFLAITFIDLNPAGYCRPLGTRSHYHDLVGGGGGAGVRS